MDGEVAIQRKAPTAFIYRGVQMVDEENCGSFAATNCAR
jgi:hypothetical protein